MCECKTIMNMNPNSSEPMFGTVKCAKHAKEQDSLAGDNF